MSSLGIFNKETKTYQKVAGTSEDAVVDAEMSDTSANTVQNKVIKKYVDDETNELKKSVSDGKTLVATAITDKGVETAADATFAVMANNISQIETGGGELHGSTISVTTTESTLIGKTIKLSLNSTTVDTKTFDSNGACSFTDIQEAGTYSLYSTDGTDSNTITVDVTAENVINKTVISCEFYLIPDGETITPVNDVAILLKCAEIKDKSYTTMDELLADEQAIGDITMSENAMKYLARSTGFADAVCANEIFMTLLGQSAYVDATVLNSDLWKQKIKASQYWELVYASKTVTVYGGAYETITIDGYYGSFTTNADGSVSHVVPIDTITLIGSVSGKSFTRTVTNSTTDVYVMPEGALYWYGNECTWITGGWNIGGNTSMKNTNSIKLSFTSSNPEVNSMISASIVNHINNLSAYKTLLINYKSVYITTGSIGNLNKPFSVYSDNAKMDDLSKNRLAYYTSSFNTGIKTYDISNVDNLKTILFVNGWHSIKSYATIIFDEVCIE